MRANMSFSIGYRKSRGVALVLVLWIVVLLSVIGVSHSRNIRIDMQIARHHLENAKAKALAEAGLNRAIMELFNKNDATRWPLNGTLRELPFADGNVQVMIRNTAGLVDINTASQAVLEGLFSMIEMDERRRMELVDAILDWRDTDDLRRLNGAEDAEYKLEGLSYGTPDDRFFSIGELRYVLGMDTGLYNQLAPYITVFSGMNSVNQLYAPMELAPLFTNAVDQMFGDGMMDPAASDEGDGADQGLQNNVLQGNVSKVFHISVWATLQSGAGAGLEVDVDTTRRGNKHYSIVSWQQSSQG